MFGYVKVEKGELRVREWETYRGLYCSLCRALSRRYGLPARAILSYDVTFLLAVRLAQDGVVPSFRPGRCPFNPAKRCSYCQNGDEAFDFACAAAVVLFYYKLRDDIADSGFLKRLPLYLLLSVAALWRKKAKRLFPAVDAVAAEAMAAQRDAEQAGCDSADRAAHASADALGKLFRLGAKDRAEACYRFGYCVGRWVYLIDAADDLKKDFRRHNYNVFLRRFALNRPSLTQEQRADVTAMLEMTQANAMEALEQTGLTVLYPILENIVLLGMHSQTEQIMKGAGSDERSL